MDDFLSLSNRLLSRCPAAGIVLSQQFVNDAWHTLQARREWSWRRRNATWAPPNVYQTGSAATNVGVGNPTLISGTGTSWTAGMIGRQIRLAGLTYQYYTITAVLSSTSLTIDQPWSGPEQTNVPYQILQVYFPTPSDFGYLYVCVSPQGAYRLFTNVTEEELALYDPQRTVVGQSYAAVFKDYIGALSGVIGPVVGVSSPTDPAPVSTTSSGFSYPLPTTYIVQVVTGGISGTATFQWLRAGQSAFQGPITTQDYALDLADGVQVYWPDGVSYVSGDLFTISCVPNSSTGASVPRYELWPATTYSGYTYPYIYIAKEWDLTPDNPALPPFIANRGEILLEMALEKCATFPGPDAEHKNPYFDFRLGAMHKAKAEEMLEQLETNDEEIGVSLLSYQPSTGLGPWFDGRYQQTHAPLLP